MLKFISSVDANARLAKTIIRINSTPIKVLEVYSDMIMRYRVLKSGREHTIDVHHRSVNMRPVPLGYMNSHSKGAFYLMRTPARRYKQGLDLTKIIFKNFALPPVKLSQSHKALHRCITGYYPKLESAKEAAGVLGVPIAFSRELAVDHRSNLHYKGVIVGSIKDKLKIMEHYHYMDKCLEGLLDACI